ncbi:hypothetical protein T08_14997 [Trichinella sp. T8]|nr:hypothetical protein T08_14997 [Trichinella sp. T8]
MDISQKNFLKMCKVSSNPLYFKVQCNTSIFTFTFCLPSVAVDVNLMDDRHWNRKSPADRCCWFKHGGDVEKAAKGYGLELQTNSTIPHLLLSYQFSFPIPKGMNNLSA